LENLQNLSVADAKKIYKAKYWDANKIDQIEDGDVRYFIFDFVVNSGKAIKILQKTINQLSNSNISVDGKMGISTINAINSMEPSVLYNGLKNARLEYFNYLVQIDSSQKKFLRGWKNRVNNNFKSRTEYQSNVNCK
jgi:type VI secretion system secreted protein VgrG